MDLDSSNIFIDEGNESTPSVNDTAGALISAAAVPQVDSADDTPNSETPSVQSNAGEQKPEGEKVSGQPTDELTDEQKEKIVADTDRLLADERTPKHFRHYIKQVYQPTLERLTAEKESFAPLADYGTVEDIQSSLNLVKGIDTIRPNADGIPEATAEPFARALYESKGAEAAERTLTALAHLPSERHQGWTLLHEIINSAGIDPARINEIKEFAANGYRLSQTSPGTSIDAAELALIPENLREAYASFSDAERAAFSPYSGEDADDIAIRENRLADRAARINGEREKAESEQTKAAAEQSKHTLEREAFVKDWNAKHEEIREQSGSVVNDGFVESLVKIGFDDLDAQETASNLSIAIQTPGIEGQRLRAVYEAKGIKLDPAIGTLLTELDENARSQAYYAKLGDAEKANFAKAANRQAEIEKLLLAKSNPLVAALAKYKQSARVAPSKQSNAKLDTARISNGLNAPNTGQTSISLGNRPKTLSDGELIDAGIFA